jgi:hypothetical protein
LLIIVACLGGGDADVWLKMCNYTGLYGIVLGCAWLCVVVRGYAWLCVVVWGCAGSCGVVCDCERLGACCDMALVGVA